VGLLYGAAVPLTGAVEIKARALKRDDLERAGRSGVRAGVAVTAAGDRADVPSAPAAARRDELDG